MKGAAGTLLLSCLIVGGCAEGDQDAGNGAAATAEQANLTAPVRGAVPAAKKTAGASVMRPSVAAEADAPEPPPLEPLNVTVRFDDRTMALSDEARATLDALLEQPVVDAGGAIILRGHSDSRGYDGDNLVASRKRAEAVFDYLESRGIDAGRMTVIAMGEGRPAAPNVNLDGSDNPAGRAKNRRVEIEIRVPEAEPAAAESVAPPPARTSGVQD